MTLKIGKLSALWLVEMSSATFLANQRGETFLTRGVCIPLNYLLVSQIG